MAFARVADRRHAALVGRELLGRGLAAGRPACDSTMLNAPKPAPRPIMMRMGIQPCMRSVLRSARACESFLKRAANGAARCRAGPTLRVASTTACYHMQSATGDRPIVDLDPLSGSVSMNRRCRLAWFSPMPPVRTGIAAYSAELVAALRAELRDRCVRRRAGTRGWRRSHPARRPLGARLPLAAPPRPYDLTVYQLGNSSHHDYQWPYLFRYPGLVVLHDTHLHHARAALSCARATRRRLPRGVRRESPGRPRRRWPSWRSPGSTPTSITGGR